MGRRTIIGSVLLAAMTAAILLLFSCGTNAQNSLPEPDSLPEITADETTTTTETTATETTTTETVTETVHTVTETTVTTAETFAAVTDDDPSAYQYRNYGDAEEEEADVTLPTVATVPQTEPVDADAQPVTSPSTVTQTTASTTLKTTTATTSPLDAGIAEMNRVVKSYTKNCAVLLTADDGTVLYSYQPDTLISGASLIKLPYVYFCCQQLSGGVRSLQDSITYTSDWYHGGSGIIRHNGTGKTYTVANLIDYALRYSDNVAYDMLVYLFGTQGFNDMVRSWGYSVSIGTIRFPAVSASFMTAAMTRMQAASQDGECWEIAWDALVNSEQSYIRDTLGIPDVAVKYGNIPAQYHEACYIPAEMPCTLILLSGANNYIPDVTFVQSIAKAAKMIIDGYTAKLHALTETTTETTTTETTTTAAETETTAAVDIQNRTEEPAG